ALRRLMAAVNEILIDLKLNKGKILLVFNKIDKITEEHLSFLKATYHSAIFVSAKEKINLDALETAVYDLLFSDIKEVRVTIPFDLMRYLDYLHSACEVLEKEYKQDNLTCTVRAKQENIDYLTSKGLRVKEIKRST
ncbi:MAG: hypothetical protein PHV17_09995, partial [Candidatus Omnitrophica bacterium]|nr:hypothetical protein [Candidatus Omnitrophota bacterium]